MNTTEIIFAISIIVFPLYFIAKLGSGFIYGYVILNIIIDISLGFIIAETTLIAISRALISLIFLLDVFLESRKKLFRNQKIFLFYFIFILILVPFSSKIIVSFSASLKVVITLAMYPLGIYLIRTERDLYKLNKTIIWVVFFIVLNFIFSNLFQSGRTYYSDVEFYAGNLHMSALNTATWSLLILSLLTQLDYKKILKKLTLFFSLPTLIFLIISMKRISIITLGVGIIIIFYYSKTKRRYLKLTILFFGLLLILSPLYIDLLERQIEAREKNLEVEMVREEPRLLELPYVIDEIIYSKSIIITLFGKEIFNSIGNYAKGYFGLRGIHTDFALLLFSTGIIGVLLYILIYVHIYSQFNRIRKVKNKIVLKLKLFDILRPIFIALFVGSIVVAFSGGMLGITHRTILFLYLGATIGVLNNELRTKLQLPHTIR